MLEKSQSMNNYAMITIDYLLQDLHVYGELLKDDIN